MPKQQQHTPQQPHQQRVRVRSSARLVAVERNELATALYGAAHLTGSFTLRSGQASTEYFDKFQFTSRPELLNAVSSHLAAMVPRDVEVLAGLQLGGVPLAAALSLKTGLPAVYVRLERKAYGTCRISEGVDVRDRVVAVVEDVVTTGGQIGLSTADLRAEGADVRYALAVVDREQGGHASLAEHGLDLRALFTTTELVQTAR
jgi:orotate phosphoribosyltransferase